MIRTLILLATLAGCSSPAAPPRFPECPGPVAVPVGAPPNPTPAQVGALEIRVELARERERNRGNACADAVTARDAWIGGLKK